MEWINSLEIDESLQNLEYFDRFFYIVKYVMGRKYKRACENEK